MQFGSRYGPRVSRLGARRSDRSDREQRCAVRHRVFVGVQLDQRCIQLSALVAYQGVLSMANRKRLAAVAVVVAISSAALADAQVIANNLTFNTISPCRLIDT